jgi:hypothetical protein
MARRVFFSFHYERDIWRANVVRNSWVTQPGRQDAGFWDASLWEGAKRLGDDAIRHMIDEGLKDTSVSVVLIGSETADRKWVQYEIKESYRRRNGLLGIYVHSIRDRDGGTDPKGDNPLSRLYVERNGRKAYLSELYPVYDWVRDDGYSKIGSWVETAARQAGR